MSRVQAGAAGRSQTLAGEPLARACVVGASGFAGALAAAILWAHPRVSLEAVTARTEAGRRLDDLYPRHRVPLELEPFDAERLAEAADVAFVSYPHGAAAEVVAQLRGHGLRVVDLSADFRLADQASHERWYGRTARPDLVGEAVFGLTELHRDEIAGAGLVANPGCYSTAAILALAPLARAGADRGCRRGRQERGVRRGAHRRTTARTSCRRTRTSTRMRSTGIATRRRSTRSWLRWGAMRASPSSRTCCRSTRGCSRAVT